MSAAREEILAALRAARVPAVEPPVVTRPVPPADPLARLATSAAAAGAVLIRTRRAELRDCLLAASRIGVDSPVWSDVEALPSQGIDPDPEDPRSLAGLAVCVLHGSCVVAESAAVWHVPASPATRAAALLAEHLILCVDERDLVATLNDAYARIDPAASAFGWFLSGPSKTADIEQALVFGAHGPRSLSLVLVAD